MLGRVPLLVSVAALVAISRMAVGATPPVDPCGDPQRVSQGYMSIPATVLEVETGDRLRVRVAAAKYTPRDFVGTYLVRLVAIEAPAADTNLAETSRRRLSDLVLGREVRLLVSPFQQEGLPRNVMVRAAGPDFADENLGQIAAGMARAVRQGDYDVDSYVRCTYTRAEDEAKRRTLGMWREQSP